jgi:hypothetical protein
MRILLSILVFLSLLGLFHLGTSPSGKTSPKQMDSLATVLNTISKKYGVEKNLKFIPTASSNKNGFVIDAPSFVAHFEKMVKDMSFSKKKTAVLNQFYLVEFPKIRTISEYLALKRAYAKKYPVYLHDQPAFQETTIQREEQQPERIWLNTPNFRSEVVNKNKE